MKRVKLYYSSIVLTIQIKWHLLDIPWIWFSFRTLFKLQCWRQQQQQAWRVCTRNWWDLSVSTRRSKLHLPLVPPGCSGGATKRSGGVVFYPRRWPLVAQLTRVGSNAQIRLACLLTSNNLYLKTQNFATGFLQLLTRCYFFVF